MKRLRDRVAAPELHSCIHINIKTGHAASAIVNHAEQTGADLIVMGLNERPSLRARTVGSTTDRVVRTAHAPVLIVHSFRRRYRHAVAAIDFSSQAMAAAVQAGWLATGARLRLVHVVHLPLQMYGLLVKTGSGERGIEDFRSTRLANARQALNELKAEMAVRPVPVETTVIEGEPAATLVNISRSRHVDLIALGLKERGAIAQILLGSVAKTVLRDAACDVLIVRGAGRQESV